MALDSILSTPIIPAPQKSANPAASGGSSSPGNGPADALGAGTNNGVATGNSKNSGAASAKPTSKGAGSRAPATSGKSNAASGTRSKQSAPQATQSATTKKTNAKGNANAQQADGAPANFLQALAQSQADATVTVDPAAATAAEEATGPTTGKSKPTSSDDADASSSSLAFISQSLAAAIAGVQQPNPSQAMATAADSAEGEGGGAEAVSATGGGTGALQDLVATLAKDTASGSKATADATSLASGSRTDSTANSASSIGDASAAVSAFQAHMSVGSHFQQTGPADTNPNRLDSPVGSPAFNDELGGKVTWLANQGIQSASLQLSPEHLGPVNVHISVQDGTASVSFNAAHADTRAALEQALPRLREMFATNGLTLSDANVSHQSPRGQAQKQSIAAIGSAGGVSDDTTSSTVTSVVARRLGLVDTYA